MKLMIDGVGAKHGGAATVVLEVINAALADTRVARVILMASPRHLRQFHLPESERLAVIDQPAFEHWSMRLWWQFVALPRAMQRWGADSVVLLGGGGWPTRGRTAINFIQQSLPFCPEALRRLPATARLRMAAIRWAMRLSVRRCAAVVVQTENMRQRSSVTLRFPSNRVIVATPGARALPKEPPSARLAAMRSTPAGRRLLYVGSDSPHKNIRVLVPAMEELAREFAGLRLFVTLPPDHPIAKCTFVTCLGYLGPGEVREAYELATAGIMPSLVETAGLPLVEAATYGAPVLAADRPYAHDMCGDAAVFFDPLSPSSLASAARLLLGSSEMREQMAESGMRRARALQDGRPYAALVNAAGAGAPEFGFRRSPT